jgi:ribose transport system substrate-binding protein
MEDTMRLHLSFACAAVVGLLVAITPASGDDAKPVKIAVVTNCTADFWSICEVGARKAAKDHKVELIFRQPEKIDAAEQMPIVEALAERGVNGIAVAVIDPAGQTEDLARIAKKVPLVTIDTDAEKTGRLCHIGIDNYEAGKQVGRLVKKALPNGGTVAIFIGSTKSANGKSRTQGVLDELAGQTDATGEATDHPMNSELKCKKFGKYLLVDGEAKEDGGPDNAEKHATGMLSRVKGLPDLCMVGLYAYNPPAILAAAREQKVVGKLKIVGFDEDWDTLKAVAKGEIEATVVQDPFMYGYKAVEVLAAKARGDDSKLVKEPIPYRVVTKNGTADEKVAPKGIKFEKVADFEKQLREWLNPVKK